MKSLVRFLPHYLLLHMLSMENDERTLTCKEECLVIMIAANFICQCSSEVVAEIFCRGEHGGHLSTSAVFGGWVRLS